MASVNSWFSDDIIEDVGNIKLQQVWISKLKFSGAVAFGSRALGVDNDHSDYDFIVTKSKWDNLTNNSQPNKFHQYPVKDYFSSIPNSEAFLYKAEQLKIDVVVVESQDDVEVARRSVEDLKKVDKKYLVNKKARITLYQQALLNNGWTPREGTESIQVLLEQIK